MHHFNGQNFKKYPIPSTLLVAFGCAIVRHQLSPLPFADHFKRWLRLQIRNHGSILQSSNTLLMLNLPTLSYRQSSSVLP